MAGAKPSVSLVLAMMLLAGCTATRPRPVTTSETRCVEPRSLLVVAASLNAAAQDRKTFERADRLRNCRCQDDAARCAAARKEARRVVERAKVAPGSERPRLEQRARELLLELRGF